MPWIILLKLITRNLNFRLLHVNEFFQYFIGLLYMQRQYNCRSIFRAIYINIKKTATHKNNIIISASLSHISFRTFDTEKAFPILLYAF